MELGLLDIGSAAARLELVELRHGQSPRARSRFKARTRLADHTGPDGTVTPSGIEHVTEAVRQCMRAAGDELPPLLVAFGTSAIRDAANSGEVRRSLGAGTGVRIGVLSPRAEASLTYYAAHRWFGWCSGTMTTLDIGGGPVDVASGTGEYPDEVVTLPFGAARITREYLCDDPPRPEQVEQLTAEMNESVSRALRGFAGRELGRTVALSKILRQLAALAESSAGRRVRRPTLLTRDDLKHWIPPLAVMDQSQRAALPGVSRNRARNVLAGAIVAEAVLHALGVESLEVCPWGLREGLILRFQEVCRAADVPGVPSRDHAEAVRILRDTMFSYDEAPEAGPPPLTP